MTKFQEKTIDTNCCRIYLIKRSKYSCPNCLEITAFVLAIYRKLFIIGFVDRVRDIDYDTAQGFAVIYGQQEYVNNQAIVYIRGLYQIDGPLSSHRSLSDLQPADLDNMITSSQQTLSDLTLLRHLLESLDRIYKTTAMQP